jgi:Trk-type K+ transport system membrane component
LDKKSSGSFHVAKKTPAKKELTPRQLRRQQQRDAAPARLLAVESLPGQQLPALPAPPEILGPSVLVPLFCSSIVLGCLLYHVPGFATLKGNELTWPQPLFTAVNAATLTGFQQPRNPNDYTVAGQMLTLFLTIMGMMFSFICGGVAVIRIARMRFKDWQLIAWAGGSIVAVSILGGVAMLGDTRTFSQASFQAISAFGNSGLTLGKLPAAASGPAVLVLLPLAVLGGLGLPVLMELVDVVRRRTSLSAHSRSVLSWSAGVYLALMILLVLLRWASGAGDFSNMVIDASQMSINSRSAGFAFSFVANLPQAMTFFLVLAMVIGASPAGTGGGVKVTTLATLSTGTLDVLAGRPPGRRFGAAIIWVAVYLGMLTLSTIGLLMTDSEIHLDRGLFLAASALGNVGLSHNPVEAPQAAIYVLCATMLVGRVAPVLMLWFLIDTTPDAVVAMG